MNRDEGIINKNNYFALHSMHTHIYIYIQYLPVLRVLIWVHILIGLI